MKAMSPEGEPQQNHPILLVIVSPRHLSNVRDDSDHYKCLLCGLGQPSAPRPDHMGPNLLHQIPTIYIGVEASITP